MGRGHHSGGGTFFIPVHRTCLAGDHYVFYRGKARLRWKERLGVPAVFGRAATYCASSEGTIVMYVRYLALMAYECPYYY
jgi:hypothetical protein